MPKGARLALLFASANHDKAHFSGPARFDLRREDAKGHLAFGRGIHFCAGAPLAPSNAASPLTISPELYAP